MTIESYWAVLYIIYWTRWLAIHLLIFACELSLKVWSLKWKLLRRTFTVYYALPNGSSISGHETKIGEGCMQAPPGLLSDDLEGMTLSLCRLSLVSIVQTGLFLAITLPWKVIKSSRINPPGPDAVVYSPYGYKPWWYDDVFIYRLDPRDNPKRKWKPKMSLSQCLTLITIANFLVLRERVGPERTIGTRRFCSLLYKQLFCIGTMAVSNVILGDGIKCLPVLSARSSNNTSC